MVIGYDVLDVSFSRYFHGNLKLFCAYSGAISMFGIVISEVKLVLLFAVQM